MTSDPLNYRIEYSFRYDVISVLKNSIECTIVFFKCLLKLVLITLSTRSKYINLGMEPVTVPGE